MHSKLFQSLLILLCFVSLLEARSESEALDYLNKLRKNSGMTLLGSDRLLDKAASSHASYLLGQQRIGHFEQYGHKGFTGKTPSERVVYHGFASKDVMENVSINAQNHQESIDKLMAAIYHRFVFLSLDKDLMGSGVASTGQKKQIKNVYVYDLGSKALNRLCQERFTPANGVEYLQHVCMQNSKLIPRWLYEQKKEELKSKNTKAVLYPYEGQQGVSPVFYEELPDPLPDYSVSGYPVSVQFNDSYFKQVKLISFKLYDEKGREFKSTRLLSYQNDPNKRFKEGEYALMPLKRLEYATTYTAKIEARLDGETYRKIWSFSTIHSNEKLYRISDKKSRLKVSSGSTILLYFVPASPRDVLKRYKASRDLKITFFDQNTLRVKIPSNVTGSSFIEAGGRKVVFTK